MSESQENTFSLRNMLFNKDGKFCLPCSAYRGFQYVATQVTNQYRMYKNGQEITSNDKEATNGPTPTILKQDNVVVEVVKKAEDSDDTIIRLYECYNRRTPVELTFGKEVKSVVECNMMEEGAEPVEFAGNKASFMMKPYEIKTLKVTF